MEVKGGGRGTQLGGSRARVVSRYVCVLVSLGEHLCVCIPQVCADVFLSLINQTFTNRLLCAMYWLWG